MAAVTGILAVMIAFVSPGVALGAEGEGAGALQRWVIDPERTEVRYYVEETFLSQMSRGTAVGVTRAVEGEAEADPADWTTFKVSPVRVDISRFESDQPRRDERIRGQWLESERYPVAEFVTTSIEGLPEEYEDGAEAAVTIHGELTVRDVTRPVVWEGILALRDGALHGSLTTDVLMTDFGFDPPSILGVLKADNEVHLEFEFTAMPAP